MGQKPRAGGENGDRDGSQPEGAPWAGLRNGNRTGARGLHRRYEIVNDAFGTQFSGDLNPQAGCGFLGGGELPGPTGDQFQVRNELGAFRAGFQMRLKIDILIAIGAGTVDRYPVNDVRQDSLYIGTLHNTLSPT